MESKYLKQKEREFKDQCSSAQYRIHCEFEEQRDALEKKAPSEYDDDVFSFFISMIPIGIIGTIIWLFAAHANTLDMFMRIIFKGTFVYPITATVVYYVIRKVRLLLVKKQVADLCEQEQAQCKAIEKEYAQKLAQEKARFPEAVKTAKEKYGSSATVKPVVDLLVENFQEKILAASRATYIYEICVDFYFDVASYRVFICEKKYEGKFSYLVATGRDGESFGFQENNIRNIPEVENQIGLAQALAKLVQFEIMRKYPKDPIAPSGARPQVSITSEDTQVHLCYSVVNANYITPKSF